MDEHEQAARRDDPVESGALEQDLEDAEAGRPPSHEGSAESGGLEGEPPGGGGSKPRVPEPDAPADPGVPAPDDPEPLGPGA